MTDSEFLVSLSHRLRSIPVRYGMDGDDIDRLASVAQALLCLERESMEAEDYACDLEDTITALEDRGTTQTARIEELENLLDESCSALDVVESDLESAQNHTWELQQDIEGLHQDAAGASL